MENCCVVIVGNELHARRDRPDGLSAYFYSQRGGGGAINTLPVYPWLYEMTGQVPGGRLSSEIRIGATDLCAVKRAMLQKFQLILLVNSNGGDFELGKWAGDAIRNCSESISYGIHDVSSTAAQCIWSAAKERNIDPHARSAWHVPQRNDHPPGHCVNRRLARQGCIDLCRVFGSADSPFDEILCNNLRSFPDGHRPELIFRGGMLATMGLARSLGDVDDMRRYFYSKTAWPEDHIPVKTFWGGV